MNRRSKRRLNQKLRVSTVRKERIMCNCRVWGKKSIMYIKKMGKISRRLVSRKEVMEIN